MKTQRAPTARAAARSVAIPSPIMIASPGSRPTAWAAASSRYGAGLPIETGTTPVAASTATTTEPAPGSQPALGRVDRVAVRGDEMGAGPDAVGGDRQPHVGQVRVEPDDDRVRVAGRRVPVDPLLGDARRGRARADHVVALVAQLALEAAGAQDQDAPDPGVVRRAGRPPSPAPTRRPCSGETGAPIAASRVW